MLYLVSLQSRSVVRWRPAMPIHPELGDLIIRASCEDEAYGRALMRGHTPLRVEAPVVTDSPEKPYQGNAAAIVTTKSELAKSAAALVAILETALDAKSGRSKVVHIDREKLAEAFSLADFVATQLDDDENADSDD